MAFGRDFLRSSQRDGMAGQRLALPEWTMFKNLFVYPRAYTYKFHYIITQLNAPKLNYRISQKSGEINVLVHISISKRNIDVLLVFLLSFSVLFSKNMSYFSIDCILPI